MHSFDSDLIYLFYPMVAYPLLSDLVVRVRRDSIQSSSVQFRAWILYYSGTYGLYYRKGDVILLSAV